MTDRWKNAVPGSGRLLTELPTDTVYKTIVIDPPWVYEDSLPGPTRGASKNYDCLTYEDVVKLPVPDLADTDAFLWVWVTNAFFEDAFRLIKDWGFKQKTILTWVKPKLGMGHYLRNTTEHCLLATRGSIQPLRHNVPSHVNAHRTTHSRKPPEAYAAIRIISPGPRLDIFGREPRPGFDVYGDEIQTTFPLLEEIRKQRTSA